MVSLLAYFLYNTLYIWAERYRPPTDYSTDIGGFTTVPDMWTCLAVKGAAPAFTSGYVQHPPGNRSRLFGLFDVTTPEKYEGNATGMKESCIKFHFSSVDVFPLTFHLQFTAAWSLDTNGSEVIRETPQYHENQKFAAIVMTDNDQLLQTPLTLGIAGETQFEQIFSLQQVNIENPDYWWKQGGWKTFTISQTTVNHLTTASSSVPMEVMRSPLVSRSFGRTFDATDPTVVILSNHTGEEINAAFDPRSDSKRRIIWVRWHLILEKENVNVQIRKYRALVTRLSNNLGVSAGYMSIVSALFYMVFRRKFPIADDEKSTLLTLRGHEEMADHEKKALQENLLPNSVFDDASPKSGLRAGRITSPSAS
jgi:hypothetical protein